MKKLQSNQMEAINGGLCWEFNVTIFGHHIVSHYCDGQSADHSYWDWF